MNATRFGDRQHDIAAEAASAALAAYRESIREQTRQDEFTDPHDVARELLTALMHYGDRTEVDFAQALAAAARSHAGARFEEPYPVGGVVDDGARKGLVTGVNHEAWDEYSYRVACFGDPEPQVRLSGEVVPAIFPAVTLSDHQVHTIPRAYAELAQLEARLEIARQRHSPPPLRDMSDHAILLSAVSEWTGVTPERISAELRPRTDEQIEQLRRDDAAVRGSRDWGAAEQANVDFAGQAPPINNARPPETPSPRTAADPPARAPRTTR